MTIIDYIVVVVFLLGITSFGMMFSKKASGSTDDYIVAGRKMPWWLAGTSMTATGMNPSAPLQDAGKIQHTGIAGVWYRWSSIIDLTISSIFFDRLWRRSRITTAVEFYNIRYSGKAAAFARIFDVSVLGIIGQGIFAAIGMVAMKKVVRTVFTGLPEYVEWMGMDINLDFLVVLACVTLAVSYSITSGVHGVVWTDLIEFFVVIACSATLLCFIYADIGWMGGLRDLLLERDVELAAEGKLQIMKWAPTIGPTLIGFLFIKPLFSLGQYNASVQRMLCVKDEREVLYTMLWRNISAFTLRQWPWLICGLAGVFLIDPEVLAGDPERMYPALIAKYMPVGLLGLMIAGFISGFMAAYDTNAHAASAIFVNDLYRPYLVKGRDEHHYIKVARIFMVALTALAIFIAITFDNLLALFFFAINIWSAPGIVRLVRWIWWRVNVWMEVSAQITGLIMVIFFQFGPGVPLFKQLLGLSADNVDIDFTLKLIGIGGVSSLVSLIVCLLTKPEPTEKLTAFYQRVRPYGWWGPIAAANPEYRHTDNVGLLWVMVVLGITLTISATFGFGAFLLGLWTMWIICTILFALSIWAFLRCINKVENRAEQSEATA